MFSEYLYVFVFLYLLFNVLMTRCEKLFMFNPFSIISQYKGMKNIHINTFKFRWHHLYTGIALVEYGYYCLTAGFILVGIINILVGLYLIIDDIYQHREQRKRNDPNYHTFGHKIGKPFYHLRRWIVKKTGWKWLGKL